MLVSPVVVAFVKKDVGSSSGFFCFEKMHHPIKPACGEQCVVASYLPRSFAWVLFVEIFDFIASYAGFLLLLRYGSVQEFCTLLLLNSGPRGEVFPVQRTRFPPSTTLLDPVPLDPVDQYASNTNSTLDILSTSRIHFFNGWMSSSVVTVHTDWPTQTHRFTHKLFFWSWCRVEKALLRSANNFDVAYIVFEQW